MKKVFTPDELLSINVFTNMPERGDVVAQLTEEELAAHAEIEILHDALNHNPTVFTKEETINILKSRNQWWLGVTESKAIPYAWPLTFDRTTGLIYVGKKD